MNYRKIWEEFNDKKIPEGYEIHHMDGNHRNNDPQNLLCVSIQEHLDIHYHQQDWGAVQAILIRMNYQKDDYLVFDQKIPNRGDRCATGTSNDLDSASTKHHANSSRCLHHIPSEPL